MPSKQNLASKKFRQNVPGHRARRASLVDVARLFLCFDTKRLRCGRKPTSLVTRVQGYLSPIAYEAIV